MKLLKLVPDNTNIHFLKWRIPFYVVSVLLMAASIALVATRGRSGTGAQRPRQGRALDAG